MQWGRLTGMIAGGLILLVCVPTLVFAPAYLERKLNTVAPHQSYVISGEAQALHDTLLVADLHADSLLWQRDLLERSDRGHVDLPRLFEGNVALQVFTTVTKSPRGQNLEANESSSFDNITPLTMVQLWPLRTWGSLHQRAIYQSEKLDEFTRRADGAIIRLLRRGDVQILRDRLARGEQVVGALLGTEGLHVLEADLDNVDRLYSAGFRLLSLQHFFDNGLGGSLHGVSKHGLTTFGKAVVRRINELEIVLDLSHSSQAVVRDVINLSERPVIVSHTGLHGHCPGQRNIPDDLMRQLAARGGLVGVGYWKEAVCGIEPRDVVAAIRYAIDLLGVDHVGLGSDFDGSVHTGFDTSELAILTQTMLEQRFSQEEIRAVMGGNLFRFFSEQLPE